MKTRFQTYFPFVSKIFINPWPTTLLLLLLALPAALLSLHYSASLICLAASVYMISTQKKFINYILLTPVNIFAFLLFTGPALGVSLVTYANYGLFQYGLLIHQVVSCVTALIATFCINIACRQLPRVKLPLDDPRFDHDIVRPLTWVGWSFLSLSLVKILVFAVTGAGDRGYYGEAASIQFFGPWTFFAIFPRLADLGFFLLPLIWFRSAITGRLILVSILSVYFVFAIASGSRGSFTFPLVYISCGFYLFCRLRAVKMDLLAVLGFLLLAPLFVMIDEFRTSEAFKESRLIDIGERLAAFGETGEVDHLKPETSEAKVLGGRLVTVHDYLVYEKTPSIFPYAGAEGFKDFYWVWIPFFFAQDRPIQQDAHLIAIQYRGVEYKRRTRNRIGFNADLYRRFSWPGIVVGNVAFFSLFGIFYKKVFDILILKNALFGMLLLFYTFSYFHRGPTSTVIETWWQWAYEFPKHLVLMFVIYYTLKILFGYQPRGLSSYRV